MPMYLEKLNEKEMQEMGSKLEADDIYNINKSSIKDAICMFGGGCTAEVISPEGLLLTNHHCGFGSIQRLSSVVNNYVDDGYWAMSRDKELPCAGLTVMFVSRMEDVTVRALSGVTDLMGERERQSQIDKNIEDIKKQTKIEKWEDIQVRPFYKGNQYFMFVTVTYRDIRLVGTPPSSIGKFGADTDNWVWPRHTGDFSMFRIYADKDNRPADYAEDNKPYTPGHFLPISLAGVEEGDFTMVFGFPGRTDEYLPEAAVRQIAEVVDPARVEVRDRALKIMDGYMRADLETKINYIARYASIANGWKKWLGEMQGLEAYGALEKKAMYEKEFTQRIQNNPNWNVKYKNILPQLNAYYKEIAPYEHTENYYSEVFLRNCQLMALASTLERWANISESNPGSFASNLPDYKARLERFYASYNPALDQAVFAGLMELYAENVKAEWGGALVKAQADSKGTYQDFAQYIFSNSIFANSEKANNLFSEKPEIVSAGIASDPAVVFFKNVSAIYRDQVAPKVNEIQPSIDLLQRQYMAAQMVVFPEKRFFPDANSTMRITYGKVDGYQPRDAVEYLPHTYLDGVIEKYVPGDYEFDVPAKLLEIYKKKDFGRYADATGRVPVGFIGTNHTTGGNSGSPALDAYGNLVGLNFDRVWEGTMSDLNYDPEICRNIMVDVRYILFIIDKYAGAGHLIDEMNLVTPKKSKKKKRKK